MGLDTVPLGRLLLGDLLFLAGLAGVLSVCDPRHNGTRIVVAVGTIIAGSAVSGVAVVAGR